MSNSLDPRINRLGLQPAGADFKYASYEGLPFEIFWIAKPGKPYEHVGIMHAADVDLALIYAKEQFSRRGGNCYGLLSINSQAIWASTVTEAGTNAFDQLAGMPLDAWVGQKLLVFGLKKRGKQHLLLGEAKGQHATEIYSQVAALRTDPCLNVWVVPASETSTLEAGPEGLWQTLHEKQYREATAYKSADKIKAFVESRKIV